MNGNSFRVWSPPGSRYKIEYSNALLREVRMQAVQADASGLLYGVRENDVIRVVAARASADVTDPRLAGLEPIGIFASRLRGEVFLTEADLERFEKVETGAVALVVAGTRAGFFVHEPDGSLQSIKSHLEFSVEEDPPQTLEHPQPKVVTPRAKTGYRALVTVLLALLLTPVGFSLARIARLTRQRPPLALSVQEQAGALRIVWNPLAISGAALLEIKDGAGQQSLDVTSLNSVTYVPHTGNVEIRLAGESAHFIGPDPTVPPVDPAGR